MKKKLKIYFLHPSLAYQGGAELSLIWLANELQRRGHDINIVTGAVSKLLSNKVAASIKIINLNRNNNPKEWRKLPSELIEKLQSADIVNPHSFPSYLWLANLKANLPPVMLFCHEPPQRLYATTTQENFLNLIHNTDIGLLPFISNISIRWRVFTSYIKRYQKEDLIAVNKCDEILANSNFTVQNIKLVYKRHAKVCYIGIEDLFSKKNINFIQTKKILMLGRLSAIKNVDIALQAFFLLKQKQPSLLKNGDITIIGDGWQRRILLRKIRKLRLEKIINILGSISQDDVISLYNTHQIVLYIPFDEPLGIVPIEAMAASRPVIGSAQGGVKEIIINDKTGILVNPDSSADVSKAIVSLLSSPEEKERLGKEGRKRYLEHFTIETFADNYLKAAYSLCS